MKRYRAKHEIAAYIGATKRTFRKGEEIDLPPEVIEQKLGMDVVEPIPENDEPDIEDEEDPWR